MISPPITLEALTVLDAIERRGSYAGAAEQLNKVPSALSYIVQKLEEQLSVTLFARQGRRSVLTPAGQHLLQEGRKVLNAVDKLTAQTQTISHGWEPKLRIAIDSIVDVAQIYPVLKAFLDQHPTIEIDVSEEVLNGSWEALIRDKVDLVIGAPGPKPTHQGLRIAKFGTLDHVLVVPKGHELTTREHPILLDDVRRYRTVVVHDSSQFSVPRTTNVVEQSQHFFVDSVENKIQAIQAGLGVGFIPKNRMSHRTNKDKLQTIEIEAGRNIIDIYMAWKLANKGKGLAALTNLLAKSVNKEK